MTGERDPVRWLDAGDDCDPALRAVLEHAQRGLPEGARAEALARGIEQALTTSAADGGEPALRGRGALRLSVGVAGVGLAVVLAYFGATREWSKSGATAQHAGEPGESRASTAVERARVTGQAGNATPKAAEPAREAGRALPELTAAERLVRRAVDSQRAYARPPRAAPTDARTAAASRASEHKARASSSRSEGSGDAAAARSQAASPDLEDRTAGARASDTAAPEQKDVPSELQLLMAAQRALRVSPRKTLEFAEQHARAYPTGRFTAEREEIAIAALFALGDSEQARVRAGAFLERYPHSLARPRVERMLERMP